jgi:hypothetical protein
MARVALFLSCCLLSGCFLFAPGPAPSGGGLGGGGVGGNTGGGSGGGGAVIDCRQQQCPQRSYCDLNTGNCIAGCVTNSDCGNNSETCNTSTRTCDCASGFHDCSGACVSNASAATCGNSCTPCPSGNGTASCSAGQCQLQCNPGFLNCGGTCATCPATGSSFACNGNHCEATSCAAGARACNGVCAPCPDGATATACSGTRCVATECGADVPPAGQYVCGEACCSWRLDTLGAMNETPSAEIDAAGVIHVVGGLNGVLQHFAIAPTGTTNRVVGPGRTADLALDSSQRLLVASSVPDGGASVLVYRSNAGGWEALPPYVPPAFYTPARFPKIAAKTGDDAVLLFSTPVNGFFESNVVHLSSGAWVGQRHIAASYWRGLAVARQSSGAPIFLAPQDYSSGDDKHAFFIAPSTSTSTTTNLTQVNCPFCYGNDDVDAIVTPSGEVEGACGTSDVVRWRVNGSTCDVTTVVDNSGPAGVYGVRVRATSTERHYAYLVGAACNLFHARLNTAGGVTQVHDFKLTTCSPGGANSGVDLVVDAQGRPHLFVVRLPAGELLHLHP